MGNINQIFAFESGVFAFQRKGSKLFGGDGLTTSMQTGDFPLYVTSIQVTDFDVTGKVICLNDKRVIYEFGKGFGTIAIQGECLIGNTNVNERSGDFSELIDHFNNFRISEHPQPLEVTAASDTSNSRGTFRFYLSSFSLGPINAETGIVQFSLNGDLIEMTG